MLLSDRHLSHAQPYLPSPDLSPNQALLPLTATVNDKDCLELGGCDVVELAKTYGTPLFILDEATLRTACRQYRETFERVYPVAALPIYASKAWSSLAVCALAHSEGFGIDVASGGELFAALKAGVEPSLIYFHGNNKSRTELQQAIACGCTIVVDNWLELQTLTQLSIIKPQPIQLRLTPGIECHTHEYIRTGHLDSKFGFDPNQVREVFQFLTEQPQLRCVGLHAHIGSQIFERQPHQDLAAVLADWMKEGLALGLPLSELNVGGGLGIRYTESDDPPSIPEWVETVSRAVINACESRQLPLPKLICEPGRSLVGTAAVTAYTVGGRKAVPEHRTYISVDGGMSDNARPITYQAVYRAVVANRMSAPAAETVTIAGKHCESGDLLIRDAHLPRLESGDTLVTLSTGAYGYSMASNYNRLCRPAAVLVRQGSAELIIERETYADLIGRDRLPSTVKAGE